MKDVRKSLIITFVTFNVATVVNFLSSLVMARLLEPSDIGLFSMTVVFVNILHTFRDFGVTSYLLREKDLTPEKIRSASGLLICMSWSIAIVLFALAGPTADFYGKPPVEEIMRVLSIGFLLIPFGSVTYALLRRNMEAEKQAAVTAFTTFAYTTACISLAALGFGYMSMAWANLVNILATILAYSRVRPADQPWIPSFRGWGAIAGFGGGTVISNLVTNLNNALPDTLLGKRLDATAVGLYSRANGLVEIFTSTIMPAINNSAVPIIAASVHAGKPLSPDLCRTSAYLTSLAWPVLLITSLFAPDIISTLYGDKWLGCLPVVSLLCISYAIRIPFALTTNGLIALGRPYLSVFTVGSTLLIKLLVVSAMAANSLQSFAMAFVIADFLAAPITLIVWRSQFGVHPADFLKAHIPSLFVTLACVIPAILLYQMPQTWHPPWRVATVAICMPIGWLAAIFLVKHPVNHEITLLRQKIFKRA